MLSPIAQSKVSAKLFLFEVAKAQALIAAGVMSPDGDDCYVKNVGEHHRVDLVAGTCRCQSFDHNQDLINEIESINFHLQFAETPAERTFRERQLKAFPEFPGLTCKHKLAAEAMANLISLKDEYESYGPELRKEARKVYDRELVAELKLKGEPAITSVAPVAVPMSLPVPVIKIRGLVDATHHQWAVPLSKHGLPHNIIHFTCDEVDGHFDVEATLARAQVLFPKEHYRVEEVYVGVKALKAFGPLPTRFVDGIYS